IYGHSEEPEHVLASDNRPWMSTQYFKFKLITSESISAMSPNNDQNNIRYEFMTATTWYMPYGCRGEKEMTIVMKTDHVINLLYVNSFNFANGFDIVHVSVSDLVDEKTAMREAISLHYIYTDCFDMYVEDTTRYRSTLDKLVDHQNIQVTCSLRGWEVTNVSRDVMNNNTTRVVTQYYNWDGVCPASKMLSRSNSHQIINAFIAKIFELDKFIYVNMYTGRRNKFNCKIYKRVKRKVYNIPSIPFDVYYDIFIKYSKNLNFTGVYIELFSKDNGMLDVIIEFNSQRV
ncbi:41994_t:CDS:2, partial [Gigaspora margarita]